MKLTEQNLLKTIEVGEGFTIEFKIAFDWENVVSRMKYLKAMAGLFNNRGGQIIFGVDDKTHGLCDVADAFQSVDVSEITRELNNYFQPHIKWSKLQKTVNGITLGIITVERRDDIPAVCKRTYSKILSEGDVYFRYSGETTKIKFGELSQIFSEIKNNESLIFHRQTRKNDKRPYLIVSPMYSGNQITIRISNRDERAIIKSIENIEDRTAEISLPIRNNQTITLDKGSSFYVVGNSIYKSAMNEFYHFKILFSDTDGNEYYQEFENVPHTGELRGTDPIEVE